MAVEIYAIVICQGPESLEDREFRLKLPKTEHKAIRLMRVAETLYQVARVRLIQPPGRKGSVPKPKWDVLESRATVDSIAFLNLTRRMHSVKMCEKEFEKYLKKHPHEDPYGDVYVSCHDDRNEFGPDADLNDYFYVPDYKREWMRFCEALGLLDLVKPINKGSIQPLPLRHPIDDRRITLQQIRYLFPETVTMPLAIALDYVRDKISS